MNRSRAELAELIQALEIVWAEQAHLAQVYQQEASDLWRHRAEQDKVIADLKATIETLRAPAPVPAMPLPSGAEPVSLDLDAALTERLARQREVIAQRKQSLARL